MVGTLYHAMLLPKIRESKHTGKVLRIHYKIYFSFHSSGATVLILRTPGTTANTFTLKQYLIFPNSITFYSCKIQN